MGDDFGELYSAYLPRVLNFMRVRVGDTGLAEDLTATVFERAFAHQRALRTEEAFAGWLFRIARNTLAEHFRRRGRRGDALPLDDALEFPTDTPEPEELVHRREELERLVGALRTLSQREQDIVTLRFVAGLTNRAVAQAMHLSEGNVAVILYRALRRLRGQLGERDG
ncbi:MAG: sigma-70 family RNA polymerase sigma factor [Anaerolineae bacterium]|nr:sigma-70 family RNA polymerase sigma factor [Anaerolineae bacterium]